jgi:glycosyltransferase involved in cell wall biosynthesis
MRIAFFIPYFGDGGVERTTLILGRFFIKDGHSVDLLTLQAWGPFLRQIPREMRIIDLKTPRTITALPKLVKYLREVQPTALISAQYYANIVSIWRYMLSGVRTRLIVTERLALSKALSQRKRFTEYLFPYLIRKFYPKVHAVVANSEDGAKDLAYLLGWPQGRVYCIYNPTYDDSILERAKEPVEHPWFQPGEPPIILSVGRLTFQKDYGTLLRAFARVRKELPCRLVILGEGEGRERLEMLAGDLGVENDVDLPGFVENPYRYMARASIFVLSSRYEGLPNVLIEALACGVPIVSTDCLSGPKEILLDGKAGLLVPVGDEKTMAHGILSLLRDQDRARHLVMEGQRHLERFRPEICYQAYVKLIGEE